MAACCTALMRCSVMQGLWPLTKRRRVKGVPQDIIKPESITCHCETDIFALLGLSYVPPVLRVFNLKTRQ